MEVLRRCVPPFKGGQALCASLTGVEFDHRILSLVKCVCLMCGKRWLGVVHPPTHTGR